jgi:hypothetical protein
VANPTRAQKEWNEMADYMGHRLFVTLSGGGVEGYFAHDSLQAT